MDPASIERTLPNGREGALDATGPRRVPADPLLGQRLTHDVVLEGRVARGSSSLVYKGRNLALQLPVAVKVLDDRHVDDVGIRDRLRREARTLARLRHPGIVRLLDLTELSDGRPALLLEWLDGEDLETRLRRCAKLDEGEAIRIAVGIAAALEYAHAHGVIHRDLKPANVFLHGPDEDIVLLDFGVARDLDSACDTATGGVLGTPAYMAPEQAADASRVSPAADVYALGAVLFRMLSGETPYPRDEPMRTLRRISTERPRALSDLVEVTPRLAYLVDACLARDPAMRPGSAATAADSLLGSGSVTGETAHRMTYAAASFAFLSTVFAAAACSMMAAPSALAFGLALVASSAGLLTFLLRDSKRVAARRWAFGLDASMRAGRTAAFSLAAALLARTLATGLDLGFMPQSALLMAATLGGMLELSADAMRYQWSGRSSSSSGRRSSGGRSVASSSVAPGLSGSTRPSSPASPGGSGRSSKP